MAFAISGDLAAQDTLTFATSGDLAARNTLALATCRDLVARMNIESHEPSCSWEMMINKLISTFPVHSMAHVLQPLGDKQGCRNV